MKRYTVQPVLLARSFRYDVIDTRLGQKVASYRGIDQACAAAAKLNQAEEAKG